MLSREGRPGAQALRDRPDRPSDLPLDPALARYRGTPARRVAMQILRHSQIAVTVNVYSEAPSKATRTALKRLGKRLDT